VIDSSSGIGMPAATVVEVVVLVTACVVVVVEG
jgi:hypothetical protein